MNRIFSLVTAAAIGMVLLTACPSGKNDNASSASAAPATTTTTTSTTKVAAKAPAAKTVQTAGNFDAKAAFGMKCAACHGAAGQGGACPVLIGVGKRRSDAFISNRITNGSPTKGMPNFGAQLKPTEIAAMVKFVKTL